MSKSLISNSVIRRLPRYYRFLGELEHNGYIRISSRELSEKMGLTASQIRQDFNCFGEFGQQGYGIKLIQDFNLDVKTGQRVAIVGPTGCGKSTIINLLLRFYAINQGSIEISGSNIYEITYESLRNKFGMVLQETWVFTGTVAENIAYGAPEATRDQIIEAAKAVYAHSFIKRLPNGYDTVISENCGLSQGQKQLICIARIMLMSPPILILDEATSSIDLRTEQRIQKAFIKLMDQNKTLTYLTIISCIA